MLKAAVLGATRMVGLLNSIVIDHNTIRGAIGCAILNAEYLKAKKYL